MTDILVESAVILTNLSKISIIVSTRSHISQLKCTKFDFGGGFAADPNSHFL